MLNNSQPVKPIGEKNRKLSRWRSLAYLMIGICIVVIYLAWRINAYLEFNDSGSQSYEMGLGASAKKYVVGDLGGMKVRMPRYYAELVEYADDPGFGEARKVPRPKRTLNSRLRSFGMDVHFSDMKGLVDAQARKEKRRQPLRERTWLYVGVSADKSYYGDGSLDRLSRVVLKNLMSIQESIGGTIMFDLLMKNMVLKSMWLKAWIQRPVSPHVKAA